MKSFHASLLSMGVSLALPLVAPAAEPNAPAGRPKWDMDYGPFMNLTLQMPGEPETLATPKAVLMRVGPRKEGCLAFDTDLLRCVGGWTGGFFNLQGVAFNGSHGGNPGPVGAIAFRTSLQPGWSKAGSFKDPRALPTGFGASTIPYGPLPSDWAKFKGFHRNGEKVVLSYTVGGASLLEAPDLAGEGESVALLRHFHVTAPGAASTVLVAEVPESASLDERNGCVILACDPKDKQARLVLRAVGAPEGAKWKWIAPGKIGLELPDFKQGQRFSIGHWRGSESKLESAFSALNALAATPDLEALAKPGPGIWPDLVSVKGKVGGESGAYQCDKIAVPVENPWRAWLRIGGIDIFKDGRVAFSTLSGDVWVGSGIDDKLEKITWKRFASGLHQPLGLKIIDDAIHVTCRDGILRLLDENNDGEADFFQTVNNEVNVTPNFHEFMFDLQTDSEGNMYFAKGGPVKGGGRGWDPIGEHNGALMKVSKDGSKFEVFATGLRAPNGLGMGPGDILTAGDNEGTWVPMCYLHIVKKGAFVSVPDLSHKDPLPTKFDPHVCFFPKYVDNSSGGQVWVTSDKWGPMKGRMFHLSYGTASLYEVMMEEVNGVVQGGVSRVPLNFDTGIMRARFSPFDGQLYVAGQKGWQTSGAEDGAIHRVRYTGKPNYAPSSMRVTDRGIHLGFDVALDPESAGSPDNFSIEQWNYRWTSNYGSKDYRPSNPDELGHDLVDITGVALSEDRKSVFLEVPGLQPVMQSEITMRIKAADGGRVPEKIWHTINQVARETGPVLAVNQGANKGPVSKTAGSGAALVLRSADGAAEDVRRERLIALHVPEGTHASPSLPKGKFSAEWQSILSVPLRKPVSLIAEGSGRVKVSVNGAVLFEGEISSGGKPLGGKQEFRKGGNALRVQYTAPDSGDATFRLLWASDDFAEEPVQPSVLYVPAELSEKIGKKALWEEGRALFAGNNCVACHDAGGVLAPKGQVASTMPEMGMGAPMLTEIGGRFSKEWLVKWIENPHQYRAHSRMPAVVKGAEARQQSADIAAFLTSGAPEWPEPKPAAAADIKAGGVLFANLGCIACHSTPMSKVGNDFDRVSLSHVSEKWNPAALPAYLLDPSKFHPKTLMPKTPMSEAESRQLAAFLLSFPKPQPQPVPSGDMAKGAQLAASVGCFACHAGMPGAAAPLSKVLASDLRGGCLAESVPAGSRAADYRFSKKQAEALREFLRAGTEGVKSVEKDSALEFTRRAVHGLRCVACHQMDARESVWSRVSEEGNMLGGLKAPKRDPKKPEHAHMPIPTTSIPHLTWLGEKLQPSWSAQMIAGKIAEKPRHYIVGRMPAFPAYADAIAQGLSHWHGFPEKEAPASVPASAITAELVAAGGKLLGEGGGFACTVCHDLGKAEATAPFEAPALNLAWVPSRLRLSYYERWLKNPQRLDSETKMPRYFDIGMRSQLKDVLGGDGHQQINAIRQYLQSIQTAP